MRFSIIHITTIFLLFIGTTANAQRASVQAQVDSKTMEIGDKFQLHLTATIPKSASLESIDLTELKAVENLEIGTESDWDTARVGQEILLKKDLPCKYGIRAIIGYQKFHLFYRKMVHRMSYKTNRIPITVGSVILQDSVN